LSAKNRPFNVPPQIDGARVEELLELFRSDEDGLRHQARVELSGRKSDEVIPKAQEWVRLLDPQKKEEIHPMLEILWLHQQFNVKNKELLAALLVSSEERARIAAQKVAWFWSGRNYHSAGLADSTVAGLQDRTYFESWWQEDKTESMGEIDDQTGEVLINDNSSDESKPPSEKIIL